MKTKLVSVNALILCTLLVGCSAYQPSQIDDVCKIFYGNTDWYKDARAAKKRWGMPISLTMAIMRQESSFRPDVRPERPKFLFIPLPRKSSAYGYAQAQDPAWHDYRKATGNWGHDRDNFTHAINFIGWYGHTSHKRLGISKSDPYNQYLAYHEGWGGFSKKSYNKKPQLLKIADSVKRQTYIYNGQLKKCRPGLDKAVKGWFF
jgi:hypothetical protein